MRDRQWRQLRRSLAAPVWTVGLLTCVLASSATGQPTPDDLIDAVKGATDTASAGAAVARLLDQGIDANTAEPDGTTALHWAVRGNDEEAARRLIAAGAPVETANRYGVTPLALAATNGSGPLVDMLLRAGADPEAASPGGDTPLMLAARTGRIEPVELLLDAGAAVDATETWREQTALMWAAAANNVATMNALIAAGADIEARSRGRLTPLLFAVREGHLDATSALLASGADINSPAGDDTTPLVASVINAHFELGKLLLDAGADPNLPDRRGSILHALSWIRRPGSGRPPLPTGALDSLQLARALLEAGAEPNRRVEWREIPFEVDLGIVRPPSGISVGRNFVSFVGATPFYLAAKHADVEYMQLLVDHGADPLSPTDQGVTPLMAAAGVGFWDGESPGPLNGTPETTRLEAVKLAHALGNDIHAVTDFGDTALEGDGLTLLLRHPVNLRDLDPQRDRGDMRWHGSTALHGAAMMGANLVVEYLLDQGADINARNNLGWTPLMVAEGVFVANTEKAWPETIELLRRLGGVSDRPQTSGQ
ncbi:MAG: ankyrin repeat domain-containing protein [Vicinamibacterales bacterium]|jgi:ankyrin repeat protein|nr:ankyrin repeat domain-containing protein [Vicinamibacterales bacterium]